MDTTTRYLGLRLASPLIAGASPLTGSAESARRLEDAGASAVVMHSLFEEDILEAQARVAHDVDLPAESFPEALSYFPRVGDLKDRLGPDSYLEEVAALKAALSIPVVASLNGVSAGGWIELAREIARAGADALELNVYFLPSDPEEPGTEVEERTLRAVRAVRAAVPIPIAVKLSPFFSSLPNMVRRAGEAGADGVVLFNRFYQPEIRIEDLETVSALRLSDSSELSLRVRWLALLSGRTDLTLGATGGVHTAADVIQAVMAGAHGVQMVSALLRNGPGHLGKVRAELTEWLERHEYESVTQLRGSMGLRRCPDPSAFERANYVRTLHPRARPSGEVSLRGWKHGQEESDR